MKPADLARAAACQGAAAVAELARFAHEGANFPGPFGTVEVVELLVDALKLTLELVATEDGTLDSDQGQLLAACSGYLDGWGG